MPRQWLFGSAGELASIVGSDLAQLAEAGCNPTRGDTRCIIYGHLTRMAVWNLRENWDRNLPTVRKLELIAHAITRLADPEELLEQLPSGKQLLVSAGPLFAAIKTTERTFGAVAF